MMTYDTEEKETKVDVSLKLNDRLVGNANSLTSSLTDFNALSRVDAVVALTGLPREVCLLVLEAEEAWRAVKIIQQRCDEVTESLEDVPVEERNILQKLIAKAKAL